MNELSRLDPVRILAPVGERSGQRQQRDADAFRRAMHDQGGAAAEAGAEAPAPSALQPRPADRRREPRSGPRHVDVLA